MKNERKTNSKKVSAAKVWRFMKKALTNEQIGAILGVIPASVATQAILGNGDRALGEYVLGPDLQAYLEAPSYRRKRIALRAIARVMQQAGLEVPAGWVRAERQRGPKGESKLSQYRGLLEQTHRLLQDETVSSIHGYLLQVETFLSSEIARIEAIYRYAREYQSRRKQEQQSEA